MVFMARDSNPVAEVFWKRRHGQFQPGAPVHIGAHSFMILTQFREQL